MPYLSSSAVVIHYEEALYQVYAPLPLPQDTGRQRVSLQEIAGDRSQWMKLVAASTAGTSFVMTT